MRIGRSALRALTQQGGVSGLPWTRYWHPTLSHFRACENARLCVPSEARMWSTFVSRQWPVCGVTSSISAASRGRRHMFIQTQTTPNADAVMFLPGRDVMPGGAGTADFPSLRTAASSPLARKLFAIEGVRAVFLGAHFVTVTKDEQVDWAVMRPEIFEVIMDFFLSGGEPVIFLEGGSAAALNKDTVISDDDSEVVAMIKELLETRVKPAVAEDGGSIVFRGFNQDTGIVDLELQGACSSCSSSSITLKNGVENMLRHYIPEVKSVQEVPGPDAPPMEKANQDAFNRVEEQLAKSGVLRS